jgi:hypothetical protein
MKEGLRVSSKRVYFIQEIRRSYIREESHSNVISSLRRFDTWYDLIVEEEESANSRYRSFTLDEFLKEPELIDQLLILDVIASWEM